MNDISAPSATSTQEIAPLVDAARDGDMKAFGELYQILNGTVFRYVYYRVASRALAEDLVSETFLRALRRIGTFAWNGHAFEAWLVTIARNLIADHYKSSRSRREISVAETGEMEPNAAEPDIADGVVASVTADIAATAVRAAVAALNPQQRACIENRFLLGLSTAQTAAVMGKNEGAIKTLQYRAVRNLLKNAALAPYAGA